MKPPAEPVEEEKTITTGDYKLVDLLMFTGLASSKGEARRLIEQGGVKINGQKVSETSTGIQFNEKSFVIENRLPASGMEIITDTNLLLQVGKRKFLRLIAS